MIVDTSAGEASNVESMLAESKSTPVSDELSKLREMVLQRCPKRDVRVTFEFDGQLRLHIDLRRYEDLAVMEAMLPLYGGVFHDVQRGRSPHNSFAHRVTATVSR